MWLRTSVDRWIPPGRNCHEERERRGPKHEILRKCLCLGARITKTVLLTVQGRECERKSWFQVTAPMCDREVGEKAWDYKLRYSHKKYYLALLISPSCDWLVQPLKSASVCRKENRGQCKLIFILGKKKTSEVWSCPHSTSEFVSYCLPGGRGECVFF